eukprot:scaffold315343_cov32-Tisochrysis_lutea.AAC.1
MHVVDRASTKVKLSSHDEGAAERSGTNGANTEPGIRHLGARRCGGTWHEARGASLVSALLTIDRHSLG